jgi:hypothetical protein
VDDKGDVIGPALRAANLLPLPIFESRRGRLQAEVLSQRKDRAVQLGPSATLNFENEATVRFRLQETIIPPTAHASWWVKTCASRC